MQIHSCARVRCQIWLNCASCCTTHYCLIWKRSLRACNPCYRPTRQWKCVEVSVGRDWLRVHDWQVSFAGVINLYAQLLTGLDDSVFEVMPHHLQTIYSTLKHVQVFQFTACYCWVDTCHLQAHDEDEVCRVHAEYAVHSLKHAVGQFVTPAEPDSALYRMLKIVKWHSVNQCQHSIDTLKYHALTLDTLTPVDWPVRTCIDSCSTPPDTCQCMSSAVLYCPSTIAVVIGTINNTEGYKVIFAHLLLIFTSYMPSAVLNSQSIAKPNAAMPTHPAPIACGEPAENRTRYYHDSIWLFNSTSIID